MFLFNAEERAVKLTYRATQPALFITNGPEETKLHNFPYKPAKTLPEMSFLTSLPTHCEGQHLREAGFKSGADTLTA